MDLVIRLKEYVASNFRWPGIFYIAQEKRLEPRKSARFSLSRFSGKMLTIDLSDHLALVTGATGGIGKATCLALAALGCSIAVHYNSAADTAEQVVKQLGPKVSKQKHFRPTLAITRM